MISNVIIYQLDAKKYSGLLYTIYMNIFIKWFISALAVIITAYLLPGVVLQGFVAALLVALIIGLLNIFVRPLLFIFTLPINILTLGLFSFVINAVIILLASGLTPGFKVNGFLWALLFSIIVTIVNSLLDQIIRSKPIA